MQFFILLFPHLLILHFPVLCFLPLAFLHPPLLLFLHTAQLCQLCTKSGVSDTGPGAILSLPGAPGCGNLCIALAGSYSPKDSLQLSVTSGHCSLNTSLTTCRIQPLSVTSLTLSILISQGQQFPTSCSATLTPGQGSASGLVSCPQLRK